MAFVNYRAKQNSLKCETCKFNFVHNYSTKIDDKGIVNFLDLDDKVEKALKAGARGAMWATCKACPNREDFAKMYGVEPVKYFSDEQG